MGKYRRRTTNEVEAEVFSTNSGFEVRTMDRIVSWLNQGQKEPKAWHNGTVIFIRPNREWITVDVGDWIVKEGDTVSSMEANVFDDQFEAIGE